jgi:hypothetical protein
MSETKDDLIGRKEVAFLMQLSQGSVANNEQAFGLVPIRRVSNRVMYDRKITIELLKKEGFLEGDGEAPRMPASEFVYLIGCNEFVKIGKAEDVRSRLASIQQCNPHKIKLLAAFESADALSDEASLHKRLELFRVRGEWFAATREFKLALCRELTRIFVGQVKPSILNLFLK